MALTSREKSADYRRRNPERMRIWRKISYLKKQDASGALLQKYYDLLDLTPNIPPLNPWKRHKV